MKLNMKIKAAIISSIAIIVYSITIGVLIYYFASKAIVANISESLTEIAQLGAKTVETNLKGSLECVETIAAYEYIYSPRISLKDKISILKSEAKRKGFTRMSIVDMYGNSMTTDGITLYVGDRDYYRLARNGQKNISDPIVSRIDNRQVIAFAVPIVYEDEIVGVLYSTQDLEALSKITDTIKLGEHGRSYIIDGLGVTIAHERRDYVRDRVNITADWDKLGLDKTLYDFFSSMQKNDKGAGQYILNGKKTYAGYAMISGTQWYFGISAPRSEAFRSINQVYFYLMLLLSLVIVICLVSQLYIRILKESLKSERNIANTAVDTANLLLITIDEHGVIYDFNRHAEAKLGYRKAEAAGRKKLSDMIIPDDMEAYDELMSHILSKKSLNGLEMCLRNPRGENVYTLWNLRPAADYDYFELVGMDISQRIKNEKILQEQYEELLEKKKKIHSLAYYDSLTGLPNRTNLKSYFYSGIKGKQAKASLLYLDLDNFMNINDIFGHSFGDTLLIQAAERIQSVLKQGDMAARLGGDDFIILIYDYGNTDEIERIAEKLLKAFESGFILEGLSINISASIGIALYPDDGQSFGELMKWADTAMYAAKESGRRSYVFFNKKMNDSIVRNMKIQNSIKRGIENKEFILYYQPQYEIVSEKIKGFEALLRWNSSEHGFIFPMDFIGIAENSGLIIPLGRWVLNEACDFIKHIIHMGYDDISVSVNVSVIQLMQEDFVSMVEGILKDKGLKPSSLELEITESILIQNIDLNLKKIEELRALGVRISLDDFGTGYSSLTYLKELPINILKVDKSFIDGIMSCDEKNSLAGSIIAIAHELGLEVIAEGVEKEEQLKYLEWYNCDMAQGYLFSKPLPREEAMQLIL